ncbi:hypothetical protein HAX54_029877 [Datura stramonium]|uniref:BTB domain-containing protein n=1 Tax=Datura stramonium TaxID=4076 RepID=A0ABS8V718_DATST|nr:hypothetical protein [Datura stramonium]
MDLFIKKSIMHFLCTIGKNSEVDSALESIVHSAIALAKEVCSSIVTGIVSNCKAVQGVHWEGFKLHTSVSYYVSCDDNKAAKDARDVLENISFSDDNVILVAKANYFKYLLQHLSSGSSDVKLRMAKTLGDMELTDHNKSSLFEEGVLDSLLSLLSHGEIEVKQAGVEPF